MHRKTILCVCVCVCICNEMEYYLAIKKNEIALFTGKEIELEITISTKIRQTQKDDCHISTFALMCRICIFSKKKKKEMRN